MKKDRVEKIGFGFLYLSTFISISFIFIIIYFIFVKGIKVLSWEFLTQPPKEAMTAGGVAPAILGTVYLTLGGIIFSLPLGIGCAIYLCEYSSKNYIVNIIRLSINNLAGVPSVVFGLFGLAFFVKYLGFGISILSGSLTLGILTLPVIISSSQEAILAVPNSLREASLALGASRWQTIKRVVLPSALPGILTGVILSIARIAGETAPILFTAAVFYQKGYPKSIFSEVMALPYHIYALMTEGIYPEKQTAIAYGCALLLLFLVLGFSSLAIFMRYKQRKIYAL